MSEYVFLDFATINDSLLILSHYLYYEFLRLLTVSTFWSCMLSLNMFSVYDCVVSTA